MAATRVAGMETWKSATSLVSHFHRSFLLLTTVCSLSWKSLVDLHTCTSHIELTEMHIAQIFIESRYVTTLVARSCFFLFLRMILCRFICYHLWVRNGKAVRCRCPFPACSLITHGNLHITIKNDWVQTWQLQLTFFFFWLLSWRKKNLNYL